MQSQAIAVFDSKKIKGVVRFIEDDDIVHIDIHITGLRKNGKHGFHVHQYGDMSDACTSMCAHFNPYGKTHGGPDSKNRHVGDLGNLVADKDGVVHYRMTDSMIKLRGTKANIVGRGLIIHEGEDDCGLGGDTESLKTGNAGKRIACAVIGWANPDNLYRQNT
jgi:Cu-Zn family superoxide dismutase